ncbi:MAG: hypothetical protein JSU66_12200 [Deltaproteobacteria bacterium]|nr:MAG: hypothetical protein JSU66_12200 [Deltaproteobacteria bacterium]
MTAQRSVRGWIARHRAAARLLYLLAAGLFVLGSLELLLRVVVRYEPGYYVAFADPEPGTEVHYAYGAIRFNSLGYPDDEFDTLKSKPRIGYVGDSVCYGIGAGHGYRITEVLDELAPGYEHLNFGAPGWWPSREAVREVAERAERFALDEVVYLMNLNDIRPERASPRERERWLRQDLRVVADRLRGKSYLYTHLRNLVKTRLFVEGYRSDGLLAFELFPLQYRGVLLESAARAEALQAALKRIDVSLGVVLLPYEMQISSEAEATYRRLGIRWDEERFVDRGPQRILSARLARVRHIDAYYAFVDEGDVEGSRARNGLGEYFVYDLGDRLDWNHLNRAGHRRVAEQLDREGFLLTRPAGGGEHAARLR